MRTVAVLMLVGLCGCAVMSMPRKRGPTCVASEEAPMLDVFLAGASAALAFTIHDELGCKVEPCVHLDRVAVFPALLAVGYGASSLVGFSRATTCRTWRRVHPEVVEPDPPPPPRWRPPSIDPLDEP